MNGRSEAFRKDTNASEFANFAAGEKPREPGDGMRQRGTLTTPLDPLILILFFFVLQLACNFAITNFVQCKKADDWWVVFEGVPQL